MMFVVRYGIAALCCLIVASNKQVMASQPYIHSRHSVADLVGLTPEQVLIKLGGGEHRPPPPGLEITAGKDIVKLYLAPWFAKALRGKSCYAGFAPGARHGEVKPENYSIAGMLLFRNGKFESLLADLPIQPFTATSWRTKAPFVSPPGDLPLADGFEAVLPAFGGRAPDDTILATICDDRALERSQQLPKDEASDFLWRDVETPLHFRPGEEIDIKLEDIKGEHFRTIVYRGRRFGYAILAIGAAPSDPMNFKFVGVEGRQVVWVARSLLGPPTTWVGDAICSGDQGMQRPGCSKAGFSMW